MSRQFDVHSNVFARGSGDPPFLVNMQADSLEELRTILAAPLWPADGPSLRFEVAVAVNRRTYRLSIPEMAAVRRTVLGPVIGSLAADRDRIVRALDFVFSGF